MGARFAIVVAAAAVVGCRGVDARAPAPVEAAPTPVVTTPVAPHPAGTLAVPALVGLPFETAAVVAHRAGFEIVGLRVAGSPAGMVLSQDPVDGTFVPAGTPIGVHVTTGSSAPEAPLPAPSADARGARPTDARPREVTVPNVLDRPLQVARRILADVGLEANEAPGNGGVEGLVMDQYPVAGERVPRGSVVVLRVPGFVPAPPTAPPPAPATPSSPPSAPGEDSTLGSPDGRTEASPPPASPAPAAPAPAPETPPAPQPGTPPTPANPPPPEATPPSTPGLDVPRATFPEDGSVFRGDAKVRVDLEWMPVEHATGYLLEVEERAADAWTRILGRVVADAKASIEIEPADPKHGDYRWRVRSVVGRKGGRASSWRLFAVR